MSRNAKGISLIELLIMVVMISVVATAFWNSRARRDGVDGDRDGNSLADRGVAAALEEIASNVRFAAYGDRRAKEPLVTWQEGRGNHIQIFQNDSCIEYFVDEQGCLVRRANSLDTVLGDNIGSLRLTRIGKETIVITISVKGESDHETDAAASGTRSFSAVVRVGASS